MSDINDTEFNGEGNTDQENEVVAEAVEEKETPNAESTKIAAILERKNKKIAELEAQVAGSQTVAPQKEEVTQTGLSRDEAILFAKGLTEEEVEKASKIAQIEGVTLTEAVNNEMFIAWKTAKKQAEKSAQAGLGTSKGSPKVPEKKDFSTPGLTKEEHLELFKNRNK